MIKWVNTSSYIYGYFDDKFDNDTLVNKSIAGFDLDDTLIKKDFTNKKLELYDKSVPEKLLDLRKKNYTIVIMSNQKGMSDGKVNMTDWMNKIEELRKLLKVDFYIFCSKNDDWYRKPRTGLWEEFINGDKTKSFFCGDAGGLGQQSLTEEKDIGNGSKLVTVVKTIPKDFSDTDRKFALNLKIKFLHRNEFIYGDKHNVVYDEYNYPPLDYINFKDYENDEDNNYEHNFIGKQKEMIINVGFPASGKSRFTENIIKKYDYYVSINQDTLKTEKKCLKACDEAFTAGKSVIIDNTNLTKEKRKVYIDLVKNYKYTFRCIYFNTNIDICEHNSYYRNYMSRNQVAVIPKLVFRIMNKKFQMPELSEGFEEIITIDYKINNLNKTQLEVYERYLS